MHMFENSMYKKFWELNLVSDWRCPTRWDLCLLPCRHPRTANKNARHQLAQMLVALYTYIHAWFKQQRTSHGWMNGTLYTETQRREGHWVRNVQQGWAPIIDHLVRRGAGAEDEALGEAVPAELGERDVARQGCEKQHGDDPPRHAASRTRFRRTGSEPELSVRALAVFRALFVEGNGSKGPCPCCPENDFFTHLFQVPRWAFFSII